MECIIVCHSGKGIGIGHLSRSLAIAKILESRFTCDIKFLIQGEVIERIRLNGYTTRFIDVTDDLGLCIKNFINSSIKQIFILDLHPHRIPENLPDIFTEIKKTGSISIAIDGLIKFCTLLDLIFMPTFKNQPFPIAGSNTKIVSGWDCFLLNTKYIPIEWHYGKNLLVLTGGSDATGLGYTFPTFLNEYFGDNAIEINWVVGPFSAPPVIPDNHKVKWVLHKAPQSLDYLMLEANFAITVYGVSFFELLHYGIPTVVFSPYGNKDDEELATISNEGVALVATNENDAIEKVKRLISDVQLSCTLSHKAKEKLSASNGQRFLYEVDEIIKTKWHNLSDFSL